jgi:hypothetical protein
VRQNTKGGGGSKRERRKESWKKLERERERDGHEPARVRSEGLEMVRS